MKEKVVQNYTVDELTKRLLDPNPIQNFIAFNEDKQVPEYIFDHPHSLDGIVISICTKGTARFKVNMQEFSLFPNMIVTILPNTIVEPIQRSKDFFMETLFFSFDFIADLQLFPNFDVFEIVEQIPCLPVTEKVTIDLLRYHTFIVEKQNKTEHRFRREITKGLLFAYIAEVFSLYSNIEEISMQTQKEKLAGKFLSLLRKHHKEERHISFYAEKMCLTPKYITSTIKKITGKSILAWIHEATIASAKVQLKSSNKTVMQISEELNFTDSSLFCRFFKKYTGMTPNQYREYGTNARVY